MLLGALFGVYVECKKMCGMGKIFTACYVVPALSKCLFFDTPLQSQLRSIDVPKIKSA
jgi:hypothetical protein